MTDDSSFATAGGGLSLNPEIDIAVRISDSVSTIWFSSYDNLRSIFIDLLHTSAIRVRAVFFTFED